MEASALRHAARPVPRVGGAPLLRLKGDEQLVALTRAGHGAAFEILFRRYQPRLLAFCRHMLGSSEDAEDVLQEAFAAAHRAMLGDERPIAARAWLYRIARNRCLDHLRRSPAPEAQDSMDVFEREGGISTAEVAHRRAEVRELFGDIGELPEAQRSALLMREIDSLSHEQIAAAMETTVPSVKSLLVRARIALTEAARARSLTCDDVRVSLAEAAEGIATSSPEVRRHIKACADCRAFKRELRRTNRALAAVCPFGPLLIAKQLLYGKVGSGLLGGGAASSGGSGAVTTAASTAAGAAATSATAAGAATSVGAGAAAVGGAASIGAGAVAAKTAAGAVAAKAAAGLAAAAVATGGAVEIKRRTGASERVERAVATERTATRETASGPKAPAVALDRLDPVATDAPVPPGEVPAAAPDPTPTPAAVARDRARGPTADGGAGFPSPRRRAATRPLPARARRPADRRLTANRAQAGAGRRPRAPVADARARHRAPTGDTARPRRAERRRAGDARTRRAAGDRRPRPVARRPRRASTPRPRPIARAAAPRPINRRARQAAGVLRDAARARRRAAMRNRAT